MSKNIYSSYTDKQLEQLQPHVANLVANEKGLLPPTLNKRTGRLRHRHKLPWMLPLWEKSLALINEEVQNRLNKPQ